MTKFIKNKNYKNSENSNNFENKVIKLFWIFNGILCAAIAAHDLINMIKSIIDYAKHN